MSPNKVFCICIVLFTYGGKACSQDYGKLASTAFANGNYPAAIKYYEKLLPTHPHNSVYNHNIGVAYMRSSSDIEKAIAYLEEAEKAEIYDPMVIYNLGRAYQLNYEFDKAIETYMRYQRVGGVTDEIVDRHIGNCYSAKKLITHPVPVTFVNLGPNVNTEFPDYYPLITKNEELLVFTTRRMGTKEFDGLYPSDIYMSARKGTLFEKAASVGASINSDYDEQAVGLSSDGQKLYVYFDHVKSYGDVYECNRNSMNFIAPERVSSIINSEYMESAGTITPDGNTMFFASDRPGGSGGLDLYMTRKLPNGDWGLPQNLGSKVNTRHDEDFPIPSPDGAGLYFCSRGYANMGGFDLFYARWAEDDNYFSRPVNLGYPINTPEDNRTISFSGNGMFAYVSAIRDEGMGDLDIYKVIIDSVDHANALLRFKIPVVTGSDDIKNDTLYVANKEKDGRPYRYLPGVSGVYSVILKRGNYKLWLHVPGYQPYAQTLSLSEYDYYPAVKEQTLELVPVKQ